MIREIFHLRYVVEYDCGESEIHLENAKQKYVTLAYNIFRPAACEVEQILSIFLSSKVFTTNTSLENVCQVNPDHETYVIIELVIAAEEFIHLQQKIFSTVSYHIILFTTKEAFVCTEKINPSYSENNTVPYDIRGKQFSTQGCCRI